MPNLLYVSILINFSLEIGPPKLLMCRSLYAEDYDFSGVVD